VGAVLVVLVVGLLLRLILVRLLPGSGFEVDLNAFRFWASNLADEGLGGFYGRDFFHDYTPGYLYVLWIVGIVGNAVGGIGDLIKVPPILSDLAIGYLAWSMVRELGGRDRLALAAAAVAVLNPISWFDSVVWGQVDSFGVVFLMLGLRELWRDRPERAAIYTVIAAIIKPQLGILIPLVAVVTIRRAVFPAGGFGDPERTGRPIRIVTTALAGFLTAVVLCLPFGLSVVSFSSQAPYISSVSCSRSASPRAATRTSPSTPTTSGRSSRATSVRASRTRACGSATPRAPGPIAERAWPCSAVSRPSSSGRRSCWRRSGSSSSSSRGDPTG